MKLEEELVDLLLEPLFNCGLVVNNLEIGKNVKVQSKQAYLAIESIIALSMQSKRVQHV